MEGQYLKLQIRPAAVHFFSVSANTAWDGKGFSSSVLPAQAIPSSNYANFSGLNTCFLHLQFY